jgi:hypothetical protein
MIRWNRHRLLNLLTAVVLLLAPVAASSEIKVLQSFPVGSPPVDIVLSHDRRWVFVLTEDGHVLKYSGRGQIEQRIPIGPLADSASVIAMAVAWDALRVYLLTSSGEVMVVSQSGDIEDRIDIGADATGIEATSVPGVLLTKRKSSGDVELISLEQTYPIDLSNAPSKGPEAAPVVIAVFSDFQ